MKQEVESNGQRLDSWKAIARYLSRDIRSVQRWERERGLPVHRVPGERGGAVFAYQGELDRWLMSGANGADSAGQTKDSLEAGSPRRGGSPGAASEGIARVRPAKRVWVGIAALALALVALLVVVSKRPGRSAPRAPSIAVLPLRNLSADPGQDYFVDGFTEELDTELTHLAPLRVISAASTMPYKGSAKSVREIARELGVGLVLQGSVTRDGQRVRVTSQLVDAASGAYLAARTDDGEVKDVLDFQRRIAREIAGEVRLQLSPGEQARLASVSQVDPEALDLYLQGRYQYARQSSDSIRQSLELYRAAVARAPSFARAYVGIAEAETAMLQINAETPEESFRQERLALDRALTIDPHLGDAHGLLASVSYWYDWNWPQAEREFRLALAEGALAPTEQRFGSALVTRGRFREGMAHLQSALELDPLGQSPRVNQFFGFYFQRDYVDARRQLEAVLARSPDFLAGHILLGLTGTVQRDCPVADQQALWTQAHYPSPLANFMSALANACRGDLVAARTALEGAGSSSGKPFASPYDLALGYALIHDAHTALSYLDKSADMHEPQILYLEVEPLFDAIRSDAHFIALEKRVRLR
jgi:TolB-like protein